MKHFWIALGLTGCIVPTISFPPLEEDTSEIGLDTAEPATEPTTEPAMEPADDTQDTEDTDTGDSPEPSNEPSTEPEPNLALELDEEVLPEFGLDEMFGWHIALNGGVVLKQEVFQNPTGSTTPEELFSFMRITKQWGFGFTHAAYNQDVKEYMFGNNSGVLSHELPLFQRPNRLLTMRYEPVPTTELSGIDCLYAVRPSFTLRGLNDDGSMCYEHTIAGLESTSDPTPYFCMAAAAIVPEPSMTDSAQVMVMVKRRNINSQDRMIFQGYVNTVKVAEVDITDLTDTADGPLSQCQTSPTQDFELYFGKGAYFQNEMNPEQMGVLIPNLIGRLDNLVIFTPEVQGFHGGYDYSNSSYWVDNVESYNHTGLSLFAGLDFVSANPNNDGFVWWNFEQPTEGANSGDGIQYAHDFSPIGPFGNNRFELIDAETGSLMGEAESMYYNQNNNIWTEDCWGYSDGTNCSN
jgi:hypothetical protein